MINNDDVEMATCLAGGPLASNARRAVAAAQNMGVTRWASLTRACSVSYLFGGMERIFSSGEEPVGAMNRLLANLAEFLDASAARGFADLGQIAHNNGGEASNGLDNIEAITAEHYGRLFEAFSSMSFWEEPARLLKLRLERNGISQWDMEGKVLLDAGCGGGRYTVAWRQLGVEKAVGIDISDSGISNAKQRIDEANITGVSFKQGNVMDLPVPNDAFDIVFSNGVLHHTVDWKQGVAELVRVLKPGGMGWLYLIERPGGLFWDVIEILRVIMKGERKDLSRAALQLLGIPANRIFYMLDHVMVPINVRLSPEEIERCLTQVGATEIRRLSRGADFDRVEKIHQGEPFAQLKYGVGENRYLFSKN